MTTNKGAKIEDHFFSRYIQSHRRSMVTTFPQVNRFGNWFVLKYQGNGFITSTIGKKPHLAWTIFSAINLCNFLTIEVRRSFPSLILLPS
jgi:hypothetical protein